MIKQQEIAWRSPLAAFRPIAGRDGAILLHSGVLAANAEWSFIAAEPRRRIESRDGRTLVDGRPVDRSPFDELRAMHAERRIAVEVECGAPLVSGLVGFAGYESARFVEPAAAGPASPYAPPDFWFGAYDAIAAFNCRTSRAFLLGRSRAAIESLRSLLGEGGAANDSTQCVFSAAPASVSRERYLAAVSSVIERIGEGEVFQANISQRLAAEAQAEFDPYAIFCAATASSSAPFGAYLKIGGAQILSLSPERFFAIADRAIVAEPIKGTRPRGLTQEEDARLLADLAADPKDRAENVMIADLTRNDLSKICEDHSVREESICEMVSHATVHHLVSRIGGVLKDGLTAADALATLFPCGSVTGAPKAQAMKMIAEIERVGRGPYCGAIGYLDDRGGAEMSVGIRLAVVEGRRITIPVGGGVTLRSEPAAEYDETIAKARQFLRLLGIEAPQ